MERKRSWSIVVVSFFESDCDDAWELNENRIGRFKLVVEG